MHVHFLGIAGTFMSGLALLSKELGFKVTGQDHDVYPPISEQLIAAQIEFSPGYEIKDLPPEADLIIVGNIMTRGMPIIENILMNNYPFCSGPQFLSDFLLQHKHVVVVTGTHGKTTTSSMLIWILESLGLHPGYLVGGIPKNLMASARIGKSKFFVIEGDEYDCAFFDKRSKFLHYHPKTLILNNIEFDHADIFKDLTAIITQFHHLIRLVPPNGNIIFNNTDRNIKKLLNLGTWSNLDGFNPNLTAKSNPHKAVIAALQASLPKSIPGQHNLTNALAACLAAASIGVELKLAIASLSSFAGVARRLEYKGCHQGITIYDDFAHHPTAIAATITALLQLWGESNSLASKVKKLSKPSLIVVIDLGSNSLKIGIHNNNLIKAVQQASRVYLYASHPISWDVQSLFKSMHKPGKVCFDSEDLVASLSKQLKWGDHVLFMSNRSLAMIVNALINKIK